MAEHSDEELLAQTRSDPRAFDVFYVRHERAVVSYLFARTGDAEMAADLTAETFAAALVGAARFHPGPEPAVAWLFGIARHRLLRALARGRAEDRARRKVGIGRIDFDDEELQRVEELATEVTAEDMLSHLPDDQAAAVRARVIDERPYSDISQSFAISEAVARKRVSRGLRALRRMTRGET